MIFKPRNPYFHFALGPANYVASPALGDEHFFQVLFTVFHMQSLIPSPLPWPASKFLPGHDSRRKNNFLGLKTKIRGFFPC